MVVAFGAADGHAEKDRADRGGHFAQPGIPVLLTDGSAVKRGQTEKASATACSGSGGGAGTAETTWKNSSPAICSLMN